MKTFKDLKVGDCIYESNAPEFHDFWINKIEDVYFGTYLIVFTCIDQFDNKITFDIPNLYLDDQFCKTNRKIYCTTLESFVDAISENI